MFSDPRRCGCAQYPPLFKPCCSLFHGAAIALNIPHYPPRVVLSCGAAIALNIPHSSPVVLCPVAPLSRSIFHIIQVCCSLSRGAAVALDIPHYPCPVVICPAVPPSCLIFHIIRAPLFSVSRCCRCAQYSTLLSDAAHQSSVKCTPNLFKRTRACHVAVMPSLPLFHITRRRCTGSPYARDDAVPNIPHHLLMPHKPLPSSRSIFHITPDAAVSRKLTMLSQYRRNDIALDIPRVTATLNIPHYSVHSTCLNEVSPDNKSSVSTFRIRTPVESSMLLRCCLHIPYCS